MSRPLHPLSVDTPPPHTLRIVRAGACADADGTPLARLVSGAVRQDPAAPDGVLQIPVPLQAVAGAEAPDECWQVQGAAVETGRDGAIRYARGGGWLAGMLEVEETGHGGIEAAAAHAYASLRAFQARQPERHLQRLWNFLADINDGAGDTERYRQFCSGRGRGLGADLPGGYPAATAIGHRDPRRGLLLFWLACRLPGRHLENPRQVPAWRYPRRYGPTPPGFARGTLMPGAVLAISGTASIVGHASLHAEDCRAQLRESLANIAALQASAALDPVLDARAALRIYLRHAHDLAPLQECLARHLPQVPVQVLAGDICRRELLVEIEGWCWR